MSKSGFHEQNGSEILSCTVTFSGWASCATYGAIECVPVSRVGLWLAGGILLEAVAAGQGDDGDER
jgi:hypothetical protein